MKGWKTIVFNVLAGLLLVLENQGVTNWGLEPGIVETILVIGNVILRFFTTGPAAPVAKAMAKKK